eukprot:TRINITY_DN4149_c0_g1_i1.p1 TRINITY_DN4149_c0_g1~~TRINITY_DN4149_c0_g1_i1.p1  ORF type:complete len:302 (-),score=38.14 TRINITY_DN4149_c0_g1_i1:423-1328(-)
MKVLSTGENAGYSRDEVESLKPLVFLNAISQMKVLVDMADKFQISLEEANQENVKLLKEVTEDGNQWNQDVANAIRCLWTDPGIKSVFQLKDKEFHINDSAVYFFQKENLDRFADPAYVPTVQDVIRIRTRTTGIDEADFSFDSMKFKLIDVGGQRSERKKWIHCFEQVSAVIYCVALSEYDQVLREDESQNRMKESLRLFETITNSPWFRNTLFILFLNKTDLFREKIQYSDLKKCFPKYNGGADFEAGARYIQEQFQSRNDAPHPIYAHQTCAVNTENIKFVFGCVKETLIKRIVKEFF